MHDKPKDFKKNNTPMTLYRSVEQIIHGQNTSDGAGVRLKRLLSQELHQRLDPFLMLDAFGSEEAQDYIAGFPEHPHRGFETVTYMLEGRMRHHDSAGNSGLLKDGGVQWMTAGRGVIHSEMPEQEKGRMSGFQLWLNLPATEKMCAPWYRDIPSAEIPEHHSADGTKIRVIAGNCFGVEGAVSRARTAPLYLDIHLQGGQHSELILPLPSAHNAFLYVYNDEVSVDGDLANTKVKTKEMAILNNAADQVRFSSHNNCRFILIAGRPLNENIVQHGPFVMNTKEQIMQAIQDYRSGSFA